MTFIRVTMLIGIVLASGFVSTQAQLQQILSVAGESANKAFESGLTPQVPANFKKPSKINSYSDYLKYAGQAAGILPVMPEADSPAMAPGPGPADSALAPATAMSGMGQPSLTSLQGDANYDPTIQDWQNAYKPVDKALNKMFETRITNANARQVQFQLAVAAAPLQMLINDQVVKQQDGAKSFLSGLFGTAQRASAKDASSISANPLTGTTITTPTAAAPAPTAVAGSTVTVANPVTTQAAVGPAAGAAAAGVPVVTATAPAPATAASTSAGATSSLQAAASANPLASLFSLPSFGKRKLLAN